jgi:hypothetical protein
MSWGHEETWGGLEPKHRPNPALDSAMILLDPVVEVSTLLDPDRFQLAPRSILEPVCHIKGQDSLAVRLTAVNDNPLRSTMPLESLA